MSSAAVSVFDANLRAWPAALPLPDDSGSDDVRLDFSGAWPVSALRHGDRWLTLHSRHDPIAEADRQIEGVASGRETVLFVVGLGLGYVLDALERRGWSGRVVAFEPAPALARACLARRTWHDWLGGGRLSLLVGPDYKGLDTLVPSLEPAGDDPPIVTHAVIARARPEAVARALRLAARAWSGARANQEARRLNAARYLLNTLRNLGRVAASGDVSALDGRLPGVPAIVVGAGPSLDRNLDSLRRLGHRAVIIAADTAARPLLAAGVMPALVVSIDPTEVNARHLADLPGAQDVSLIAEASLDPAGLAAFPGPVFFGRVARHHPWPWLEAAGVTRGLLRAWGSVLTTACDVAVRLGCNPIVFAGADLAFTGGRPYARGTTFEEEWRRTEVWGGRLEDVWAGAIAARPQLDEPGVNGEQVRTAPHLVAFRDWLVAEAGRHPDRRFLNATGSGILVGAPIEQVTLEDALPSPARIPHDALAALRAAHRPQPDAAPRIAAAVEALASTRFDQALPPLAEWVAFGNRDGLAGDIAHALGCGPAPATPCVPGADVPEPAEIPSISPQQEVEAAAIAAGYLADAIDSVLPPGDRSALAALGSERQPRRILDLGSPMGLAGLLALAGAPDDATLALDSCHREASAIAARLGVQDRVRGHRPIPGDALADVVVVPVGNPMADATSRLRDALELVSTDGVLVVYEETGFAVGAPARRAVHRLLETRADVWIADRRFSDDTTRLLLVFKDRFLRMRDPAATDVHKWDESERQAAERLVPTIVDVLTPTSVVDVGCGAGYWLDAFMRQGVADVRGVTWTPGRPFVPAVADRIARVAQGLSAVAPDRRDLCLCLEVAQHVPPDQQDDLVAFCTASSDVVVFSSPPPGRPPGAPGDRPLAVWVEKFLRHGYTLEDSLRPRLEAERPLALHVSDLLVVFRKHPAPGAIEAVRGELIEHARRLEDLRLQAAFWKLVTVHEHQAARRQPVAGLSEASDGRPDDPSPVDGEPRTPALPLVQLRIPAHRMGAGAEGLRVFTFRTDAARWFATSHPAALALEEDGVALPRCSSNAEVSASPRGGWCCWRDTVAFAASDRTDPRTNGRSYELRVPPHVAWAERQALWDVLGHGL